MCKFCYNGFTDRLARSHSVACKLVYFKLVKFKLYGRCVSEIVETEDLSLLSSFVLEHVTQHKQHYDRY